MKKNTTARFWLYMNKNGFIGMSIDKPTRNKDTGKWNCNIPFCNSIINASIIDMVSKTQFNWNCEPEYLEINF